MELALTWNLVLLCIFILLFSYHFLLGQDATIKLILSIYIAILAADGVAGVLKRFVFDLSPGFQNLFGDHETQIFAIIRLGLLLTGVIVFAAKSGFHVSLDKHPNPGARFAIHAAFSALSALLFLSTCLIYMSGNTFVEGIMFASRITIYDQSYLAQMLLDYYQFWFSLPAIAFLGMSFLFGAEKKEG